eukprot:366248-Chlamydomonas_euryale.AAC.1
MGYPRIPPHTHTSRDTIAWRLLLPVCMSLLLEWGQATVRTTAAAAMGSTELPAHTTRRWGDLGGANAQAGYRRREPARRWVKGLDASLACTSNTKEGSTPRRTGIEASGKRAVPHQSSQKPCNTLHGNCMETAWKLHGNCAWKLHGNCMEMSGTAPPRKQLKHKRTANG